MELKLQDIYYLNEFAMILLTCNLLSTGILVPMLISLRYTVLAGGRTRLVGFASAASTSRTIRLSCISIMASNHIMTIDYSIVIVRLDVQICAAGVL